MLQFVSHGCCISRSVCCLCCNGCTRMLQHFVSNVLAIFLDVCCKCVYLDVAYVSHICCKHFIWMLRMFYMVFKCFSGVFASVLDRCFTCFICLQTYIASVASGCFKSRSGVASSLSSLFCCLAKVSPPPRAGWAYAAPPLFLDAGDVPGGVGPVWARETAREN